MLIKRAVGHSQLGNHRQEAVSQSPRVHPRDDRHRGCRGGGRPRRRSAAAGGAAGAARAQAREREEEPAQRPTRRRTRWEQITTYNNYYEFGTDKDAPALTRAQLQDRAVDGDRRRRVRKKATWNLEDILKGQTLEERIYRHRCVEAWSMVIPWVGFPLADFIKKCEPTSKAKFVEFTTLYDPKQMPGVRSPVLRWPYVEGLRMDEAMHPLTILAVGLYGEVAAEPERRAAAARRAVEVRLQAHQVDREDPVRREAAAEHLAGIGAAGVRLLLEREPAGRSSALEPGDRAPHRRVPARARR